jgi:hypothetical protein
VRPYGFGSFILLAACTSTQVPPTLPEMKWWLSDFTSVTLKGFEMSEDLSLTKCHAPDEKGQVPDGFMICYVTDRDGYSKLQDLIISLESKVKACEIR